jgi:hypothetical protein
MRTIRRQKRMSTKHQLKKRENWELVEFGGEYGIPIVRYLVCPICLSYHQERQHVKTCLQKGEVQQATKRGG